MKPPPLPVALELAPLPRNQVGPFLILGVDKNADREAIEAAWAQRLIWARKGMTRTPLEDVNWAREMLGDSERRLKADVGSLNIDTTNEILKKLRDRFRGKDRGSAGCRPIDVEKSLADYEPPTPMPDMEEIRRALPVPELPREVPAVRLILEELVKPLVDPWEVDLGETG